MPRLRGGADMADDLTTIKGIGPGRAELLAEEFGVRTFADLAALDPDRMVTALRDRNQPVRHETVTLWIAEAGRRAALRRDGWEIAALFIVYFEQRAGELRTAAHRADTNTDAQWPGHVTSDVAAWMAEELGLDAESFANGDTPRAERAPAEQAGPEPAEPAEREPTEEPTFVAEFRLFQPPQADRPHAVAADGNIHEPVGANAPFVVELVPAPGVAPSQLRIRTKRVGAAQPAVTPWAPARHPPDAGAPRIHITGLAAGLYRLLAVAQPEQAAQRGPLILVE